jgi:hypothetical protein
MGRSSKQQVFDELTAYYRQHGWTDDRSTDKFVRFDPPATATPEEITAVSRGAAYILAAAGFGLG